MALSKPTLFAQDIVLCQLCEMNQRLKWKCLECELLMCTNCYEKIHPKFKNARNHRVVEIKDVGKYSLQSAQPDFSNTKCQQHEDQFSCLYCTSCELLVCPVCITKDHAGHTLHQIKESYLKKLKQLKDKMKTIESQKNDIDRQSKKIAKKKLKEDKKCEKVLQAVEDQKDAWMTAAKKYFIEITAEVKQRSEEINQALSSEQSALAQSKHKLQRKEEKSMEMLGNQNPLFLLQNIDNLLDEFEKETLESKPLNYIYNSMLRFTPANINRGIFGTLEENRKESTEVQNMKVLVHRKINIELNKCHHVAFCENEIVWTCDEKADAHASDIIIYKLNADIISKQNTLHFLVYDLQSYSDRCVLIADGTSTIKFIQAEKGIVKDSQYNASPFYIIAVHVTLADKIIVGARSTKDAFLNHSQQAVMRFDSRGNLERTWEHDGNKKMFTSPRFLTSVNDRNIFVVDRISPKNDARIVVLKNDGGILNTYTGHPALHQDGTLFKPFNIKQTPSNNILICDYNTHTLHLLNSSGDFLTYFDTKTIGISKPCSLAFSKSGTLFIGSSPEAGNAELHELIFNEIC